MAVMVNPTKEELRAAGALSEENLRNAGALSEENLRSRSSSASPDTLSELTLPEVPQGDFKYDPEAVAAMGANAGIMSEESMAAAGRAATEAGLAATRQVADNALLSSAIAGVAQRNLQESATDSLHARMSALDPGWRATVASAAAAINTSVDNIAQYMASYAPQMLSMGADLAETHGKIAKSLMDGEIPEDVLNAVRTNAAETGQAHGLFGTAAGGAGRAMEARDLGLVGLQLQQVGAGMAKDNAGLWSSHALHLANMGGAAQTLAKGQTDLIKSIIPEVDIAPIYDTTNKMLHDANVVNADKVFEGSLQQYNQAMGWGISMYQTEREAQAQYDSMRLQYQADIYGFNAQVNAAQAASSAAVAAANAQSAATLGAARIGANAMTDTAKTQANAMVSVAQINAAAGSSSGAGSSFGSGYSSGFNAGYSPRVDSSAFMAASRISQENALAESRREAELRSQHKSNLAAVSRARI